jgi:hypothetical protein
MAASEDLGESKAPWRPALGRLPDAGCSPLDVAAVSERAQALDQLDGAFAALNSRGALRGHSRSNPSAS